MFVSLASRLILLAVLFFAPASGLQAAISQSQAHAFYKFLMRLNTNSPLEHGGSHGTIGLGFGLGLGVYHAGVDNEILREHWRRVDGERWAVDNTNQRLVIPRLYIHKGLPGRWDVGFGLGQDAVANATLVSSYLQWTIFEEFATPALAFRGGISRLMGLATTDATNISADGVLSYGFLGMFTVYATIGVSRHQIQVRSGAEDYGTMLSLRPSGDEGSVESIFIGRSRSVGLQFQVLPPFVTLTVEVQVSGESAVNYLAKVSLGI